MIITRVWYPGQDTELDNLFEVLRTRQFEDSTHPLHLNYSKDSFQDCSALSITFDNDKPICCGSILRKPFWPKDTYRILNRFWKVADERFELLNNSNKMLRISDFVKTQLEYSRDFLNSKLIFISRQEENWQHFFIDTIKNNTGYVWQADVKHYYQTCLTPNDDSCWQKIIFYGDSSLLESWDRQ
jgi:hypothetical protein